MKVKRPSKAAIALARRTSIGPALDAGMTLTAKAADPTTTKPKVLTPKQKDRRLAARKAVKTRQARLEAERAEQMTRFPVSDWQYEVANGDCEAGYRDWLASKVEQAAKKPRRAAKPSAAAQVAA